MNITPNDRHFECVWEQAWNHYRHLETMRIQYLGFFFTFLIASFYLAVGLMKEIKYEENASIIFGLLVLTFVNFLMTIGIFTAIKKMGFSLIRYRILMKKVLEKWGIYSSEELPFQVEHMKDYPKENLHAILINVQNSVLIILYIGMFLFESLLVYLTLTRLFFNSAIYFTLLQKCVAVLFTVSATIYILAVVMTWVGIDIPTFIGGKQNQPALESEEFQESGSND